MPGFDNNVVYAGNVDFSGGSPVSGKVVSDGQLLIGATATPNIRVGSLTSTDGSIGITVGAGTINIETNSSVVGETITGNSGGARSPTAGNWNIVTSGSTVTFVGSGSTLTEDFALSNTLLGSSGPSITTGTANTGLGFQALNALAGGASNVCLGYQSGDGINSGNENVCVGRNSGGTIAGGGQNVCIGHSAGATITSGSSNILIGKTAGNSFSGGASNNICIGEGVSGSGAVSNSIRIGSTHSTCFIDGIESVTVSGSAPIAVDSNNQISSLGYGTSGYVLTSNGAATSPTWQANSAAFSPNSVINISDDFLSFLLTSVNNLSSNLSWFNEASRIGPITATSNEHPGIISNLATTQDYSLFLGGQQASSTIFPSIILGGGALTVNWVINVATLSNGTNTYTLRVGLGDTLGAAGVNGAYFEYTHSVNSGNWQTITAAASSRTTNNTAIAASGWVNLGISVNAGNTSISFSINGSVVQTQTTNLPSAAIGPMFSSEVTAGTIAADSSIIDLFYMTQTLTTPR